MAGQPWRKLIVFGQISASVVDGLLIGFVYGIAAMGLSLIWGVMRVINLAHGATMALGMFAIYLLFTVAAVNPHIALLLLSLIFSVFGISYSTLLPAFVDQVLHRGAAGFGAINAALLAASFDRLKV